MTVTNVHKDIAARTMTMTASFDAPIGRVWELWSNPRLLERWWGPPTYPATVVEHDLTPGGLVSYFMTGPDGDRPRGWWRVVTVDPPNSLEFVDGFADETGDPNPEMPTMTIGVTLTANPDGGTTMATTTTFPTIEAMETLMAMGMEEGMMAAAGQIDALLAG